MAAGDHLGIEAELPRRALGGARGVGGAHREAVDAGAVERRHVGRRGEIGGEHAVERIGERHRLGGQRREVDRRLEAQARFPRRDHLEKLLLARRAAHRGEQRLAGGQVLAAHGSALTKTVAPAG